MSRVLTITLNAAIDLSIGLDALVPGDVHRAGHAEPNAAGKGHNVACVLAALGHEVTVTGFLGAENDGAHRALFATRGLTDRCIRVAGATRTNIKISEADGRVSDINTQGAAVTAADRDAFVAALDAELARGPAIVVWAGSLPPGVSPELFGDWVARCRAAGATVWLDTSGAALAAGIAAGCDGVKPNEAELAEWAGGPIDDEADLIAAATAMRRAIGGDVIVSRGGEALYAFTEAGLFVAVPPAVDVVNTVCAGDTLLAGLLHGRLTARPDDAALMFAAALATEAVRHIGVGRADAPDFADLASRVELQRLAYRAEATARDGLT